MNGTPYNPLSKALVVIFIAWQKVNDSESLPSSQGLNYKDKKIHMPIQHFNHHTGVHALHALHALYFPNVAPNSGRICV